MDEMTLTLNSPITEEQWDDITDADFDCTDRIWFHTKHGKDVEFVKQRKGKWLPDNTTYEKFWYFVCSECKRATQIPHYMGGFLYNFCPNCGADMRGEHD